MWLYVKYFLLISLSRIVPKSAVVNSSADDFFCNSYVNKKLSYRRGTARRAVLVKTMLNVAQIFVELHLISPALGE